jgi:hypothetical protein
MVVADAVFSGMGNRMLVEVFERVTDVVNKQTGHVPANAVPDQNALNNDVFTIRR